MTAEVDALGKLVESEIRRLDQLRDAERARVDALFGAQKTAVDAALIAAEKAVAAALASAEKAVAKAEEAQLRVNSTQNEFRGTLSDQARELMPRAEHESNVRELRGHIDVANKELGNLRSRLDTGPPSLAVLQARSDTQAGQASGAGSAVRYAAVALGAVGSVLGIVAVLLTIFS